MSKRKQDPSTLTLTKVPDWVRSFLEARAKLHESSLNATAKALLCDAVKNANQCAHTLPTHCPHTGLPTWPQTQTSVPTHCGQGAHTLPTHQTPSPSLSLEERGDNEPPKGPASGEEKKRESSAHPGGFAAGERREKEREEKPKRDGAFNMAVCLRKWQGEGRLKLLPGDRDFVSGCLSKLRSGRSMPLTRGEVAQIATLYRAARGSLSNPGTHAAPFAAPEPAPATNESDSESSASTEPPVSSRTPEEKAASAKRMQDFLAERDSAPAAPNPTTPDRPEDTRTEQQRLDEAERNRRALRAMARAEAASQASGDDESPESPDTNTEGEGA